MDSVAPTITALEVAQRAVLDALCETLTQVDAVRAPAVAHGA